MRIAVRERASCARAASSPARTRTRPVARPTSASGGRLLVEGGGEADPGRANTIKREPSRSSSATARVREARAQADRGRLRLQADLYREPTTAKAPRSTARRARPRRAREPRRDNCARAGDRRRAQRLDETQGFRPTQEAEAAYRRGVQALRAAITTRRSRPVVATEIRRGFRGPTTPRGRPRPHRAVHRRRGLKRAIRMDRPTTRRT